jgi:hypothetical protein
MLRAAAAIEDEANFAWELCLSLHAVRDRLARLEATLGIQTAADVVTRALRESASTAGPDAARSSLIGGATRSSSSDRSSPSTSSSSAQRRPASLRAYGAPGR